MPLSTWRTRAKTVATALALALVATAAATGNSSASIPSGGPLNTPSRTDIKPVVDSNFADPDVLLVGGVYHAYATNTGGDNVQHKTSTDLVKWTTRADAAPTLGDWVGACSFEPGGATDRCIWAPEVSKVAGGYALYYTARDKLAPRQCIGVSFSTTPDGPFTPVGTDPLVCPDGQRGAPNLGGAIDASTFEENGQLYLLWKSDGNCCSLPATIFIQPLSSDGRTLTAPATPLISNTQVFEGAVVEAPVLFKKGSVYYLFYSANDFGGGNYRTGYATSTSMNGPYVKSDTELMTTDLFHGTVRGPGGQDVFVNKNGGTSIIFHGWDAKYSYRAMYASDLLWSSTGVPVVAKADTRYQAEDAVVANANVVGDDRASGGAKVGGLDFLDSSVTFEVTADKAGLATLGLRYANGSRDGNVGVAASHTVKVNGKDAGTLVLPNTAWGNWTAAEYQVTLKKGLNKISFTKKTWYAEIDSLDVYYSRVAPAATQPPAKVTPVRYEAENGVIVHANTGGDGGASGGAKVGGLDFLDSSVTVTVTAAKTGRAVVGIRYGSGSLDRSGYPVTATSKLTVNGKGSGVVAFPNTTWGNWQMVYYPIDLKRGANKIKITKLTFYAEIDAFDVYQK